MKLKKRSSCKPRCTNSTIASYLDTLTLFPLITNTLTLYVQHEESRVASLEKQLSDLSALVGNYDRQREEDQSAIQ